MTQDKYGKYKLSGEMHNSILACAVEDLCANTTAVAQPSILIISGQPGSGKVGLCEVLKREIFGDAENSVAIINGDDYREFHPQSYEIFKQHNKEYAKYTDPDARLWTQELLEWASSNKRNIIFESTLRQPEPINTTIKQLKAKGYKIHIAVLSVPYETSCLNIMLRYENGLRGVDNAIARWTDIKSHDEAYRNLPDTIAYLEKNNKCIDSLRVFRKK